MSDCVSGHRIYEGRAGGELLRNSVPYHGTSEEVFGIQNPADKESR